ncbi:hypothetical protein RCOM_0647090 [Ricinus communis]|uniref:GH3 middle domain-containing protein n=1 Tax=Ricinus communis TaxID=3988 RepID=B9SFL3_RICCO|nr:hypothetical protein RCOM_0647090 [Ricinus communis]
MKQYYSKLKPYTGEVMILGGDYFASECPVGINFDIKQPPETTRLLCFQRLRTSSDEIGKAYEVVVITYRGFYRYRLGDIVRIVSLRNSSPEVEFLMRTPRTACNREKLDVRKGKFSDCDNKYCGSGRD